MKQKIAPSVITARTFLKLDKFMPARRAKRFSAMIFKTKKWSGKRALKVGIVPSPWQHGHTVDLVDYRSATQWD